VTAKQNLRKRLRTQGFLVSRRLCHLRHMAPSSTSRT